MTRSTTTVRPANESDLDWMVGELRLFSEFFGTKRALFSTQTDEAYARPVLKAMFKKDLCLVAEGASPQGFIIGSLGAHTFNPQIRLLVEILWWVRKEDRGSRAAALLLDRFIDEGKARADWITFTLGARTPVKREKLLKRGFKYLEGSFLLET